MHPVAHHLRARPRMLFSVLVGVLAALLVPNVESSVTRALFGWNIGVWLYLGLIFAFMLRADHGLLRKVALAHAEGSVVVSAVVAAASLTSLVAIVLELAAAKAGARHAVPHALIALVTVMGSWLLLVPVSSSLVARVFSVAFWRGISSLKGGTPSCSRGRRDRRRQDAATFRGAGKASAHGLRKSRVRTHW